MHIIYYIIYYVTSSGMLQWDRCLMTDSVTTWDHAASNKAKCQLEAVESLSLSYFNELHLECSRMFHVSPTYPYSSLLSYPSASGHIEMHCVLEHIEYPNLFSSLNKSQLKKIELLLKIFQSILKSNTYPYLLRSSIWVSKKASIGSPKLRPENIVLEGLCISTQFWWLTCYPRGSSC